MFTRRPFLALAAQQPQRPNIANRRVTVEPLLGGRLLVPSPSCEIYWFAPDLSDRPYRSK